MDLLPFLQIEPATKSVGELDQDSVGVLYVGRPAPRPVESLAEFKLKPKALNTADGLVDVIYNKTDMVDMNVFRLESSGADFTETNIKTVRSAKDAPSSSATVTLLLEIDTKQSGVEAGRDVEVSNRDVNVIHTMCIYRCESEQSGTHFPSLDVDMGRHCSNHII